MTSHAPTHGTRVSYQAGCHCLRCRTANAVYISALRQSRLKGRPPLGSLISAKDTWIRIRQLKAAHLTDRDILQRLGLRRRALHVHPDRVRLRTALKVRLLWRALLSDFPNDYADAHTVDITPS